MEEQRIRSKSHTSSEVFALESQEGVGNRLSSTTVPALGLMADDGASRLRNEGSRSSVWAVCVGTMCAR